MTALTSHVLDSIKGVSAIGIRVQLLRIGSDNQRTVEFDITSDREGRIAELVDLGGTTVAQEFELVFHSGDYFGADSGVNMPHVVVRFTMSDREQRHHIPLVLSPHSYTVWWSQ